MPNAPVYRSVCGSVWFHIDGASGAILERLDPSRRAYRWFYSALHTMDFPVLSARPMLRSALIVIFCGFGFVFSLTGVVIGWRRLRLQFSLAHCGQHRLTPATPAASVVRDGPPAWEVKREAGASSLNAGAAPATVSDEPQAGATGNSREGG